MSSLHPPKKKSKKRYVFNLFRTFFKRVTLRNSASSPLHPPLVETDIATIPDHEQDGKTRDDTLSTSRPSQQLLSPNDSRTSDSIKKGLNVVWNGVKVALRLLEKSSDAYPPLKTAVSGFLACLDLTEAVVGNNEEYEKLAADLTSMMEALTPYVPKLMEEGVSGSLARIMRSIEEESNQIMQQLKRGKIMRTIEANQDQGDIIQRYRQIETLFRQLHNSINLQTWEGTRKLLEKNLLDPVNDARYNSSYSMAVYRRGCTAETRQKILQDLQTWVVDQNGAKIYWLNGLAGTGKTTISYSLCEWLEENKQLGGNYFCSRASHLCRNANNIVPSFAYQLAQYFPAFGLILSEILQKNPETSKLDIKRQFQKLVQEPMQTLMSTAAIPENVVVVIDALDECDNGEAVRLFLDTLLRLTTELPIKFFVTSRPEPAIRERMLTSEASRLVLHLHDIEESIVEADIRKYLIEALGSMSPPPSPNDVEQLTKRAGKLFIYAATAVRYIHPSDPDVNSRARLQTMLAAVSKSTKRYDELNRLYMDILSAAVNPERREEQEVDDILLVLKTVICTKEPMAIPTLASLLALTVEQVYFSLQPLRSVLHTQETGEGLVTPFHASFPDFLFEKRRSGEFHCEIASHNEVLANHCFDVMKRDLKFNICHLESSFVFDKDVPDLQERIEHSISSALSYACRYWGEHFRRGDLTDEVHKRLFDFLTYRLLFWIEVLNLQRCLAIGVEVLRTIPIRLHGAYPDTWKQVADAESFLTRLTAGTCMHSTPHIYISGLAFCPRTSSVYKNYYPRTRGLIDLKESVVEKWQGQSISTWTVDSHVTTIAFSPNGTRIAGGFQDGTIRIWDARTGESAIGSLRRHTGSVNVVIFSHDSTRIVSGSDDRTIQVWNSYTGESVFGPLRGRYHHSIRSVALSPSGTHLVSACNHGLIRLWDIRTGQAVGARIFVELWEMFGKWWESVQSLAAISGDGNRIVSMSSEGDIQVWDTWTRRSVVRRFERYDYPGQCMLTSRALSPDGTLAATGFSNGTIEIRDTHSGATLVGPFKADSQRIECLAFSSDSTCIASGSHRYVIHVWDACSGDALAGPFNGHADIIRSIAFSPDNARIVSSSDDRSVRIWDAYTDEVTTGQFIGHTNTIRSVALSPDGTLIASGSDDQTVRVWDSRTGDSIAGPFHGHTDSVTSVAFSPNGIHIVSSSGEKTIRVWDVRTGELVLSSLTGHTSGVYLITFSPDGTRLAFCCGDETIGIWDSQTGDAVLGPIKGHVNQINSVAFSHDGSRIVSSSEDLSVRVWDVHTGAIVAGPFTHRQPVKTAAFAPDGTRVASGACDNIVRVWDIHTGKEVAGPFTGHTHWVTSVAFSPDGARIVSGSLDCTIRIWDAYAGGHAVIVETIVYLPSGESLIRCEDQNTIEESVIGHGHTRSVNSVAFSMDGTRIVSGSQDQTIRVWDASVGTIEKSANKAFPHLSIISHNLFSSQNLLKNLSIKNLIFRQDGWVIADDIPFFWIPPHFCSQLLYHGNTLVIGPMGTPLIINSSYLFIGQTWSQCWRS